MLICQPKQEVMWGKSLIQTQHSAKRRNYRELSQPAPSLRDSRYFLSASPH
jgi:hypothetical protein